MVTGARHAADDPGFSGRLAHHAPGMDDLLLSRSGPPKHQPSNFRQHARGPRNQHQRLQYWTDDIPRVLSGRRAPWRLGQQEGRTIPLHAGSDRAVGRNLNGTGGHELSLEFLVAEGALGVGSRRLHPRNGVLSDNDVSYVRSLTDRWLDSLPVVLLQVQRTLNPHELVLYRHPVDASLGQSPGRRHSRNARHQRLGWMAMAVWIYLSMWLMEVADSEAGSFWKA
jgi:hypothetical protein